MNMQAYDYAIVRYVHDPAVGECLNIGVILFQPDACFLGAKFDHKYERLSKAFAGFDGEHYRRFTCRIGLAVEKLSTNLTQGGLFREEQDFLSILKSIFPDTGMSFQLGTPMAGITHDPSTEIDHIFERFVMSQYEREIITNRDDETVWNIFRTPLKRFQVLDRLESKTFTADEMEYTFPRAFKNGRWHVLEPASFDYVKAESLKDKATTYLGIATALAKNPEMGKLYLLLGRPTREAHLKQYERAKRLLSDHLQVEHELVEENEAEALAQSVSEFIKQHPPEA